MQIDKAKLAKNDPSEVLKLARGIKKSIPDKATHPLASQFFPSDNGVQIQELDLGELLGALAGADDVVREKAIELLNQWKKTHMGAENFYDFGWDKAFADANSALAAAGVKIKRPILAGSVTEIGAGAGSNWVPPNGRVVPTVGAKAATSKLEKALALAKAENPIAHSGLLVETLKSICVQLLGAGVENFDPNTLKTKLTAAIKARPDLARRLAKALNTA